METDEFSWNDSESVIVGPVRAIAVYSNPEDDIVIRQERGFEEEDKFIVIPRDRVGDVIAALRKEAGISG